MMGGWGSGTYGEKERRRESEAERARERASEIKQAEERVRERDTEGERSGAYV